MFTAEFTSNQQQAASFSSISSILQIRDTSSLAFVFLSQSANKIQSLNSAILLKLAWSIYTSIVLVFPFSHTSQVLV